MTGRTDNFEGLHVLLVTEDDARAQAIAKSLRERKAHVGDVRAGAKDPVALRGADLLVIDARRSPATDARVHEVRSDVRARWASVATIDYASLATDDGTVDLRNLEAVVSRLAGMDKALTERAKKETTFETTLAPLGPTRTLRALALAGPTLNVELTDGTLHAKVDLADELLVAAFAERKGEQWEAHLALARVLGMTDANVVVKHRAHPAAMNIMEPVDQALEGAAQERARAPELFQEEQLEEISGLRGERKQSVAPPVVAAAAAVQTGGSASMRPRTPSSSPQVINAPGTRSSNAPRPSFADTPTDPAAPGLLQRMARAPANDGEESKPKTTKSSSPAPVLSIERDTFDDEFEGEENYDAGEVTVVADASQLDILRETLGRIDAPAGQEPLTSTMPAPPGSSKEQVAELDEALKNANAANKPAGNWPSDYKLPTESVAPPASDAAAPKPSVPPAAATPSKAPAPAKQGLRVESSDLQRPAASSSRAGMFIAIALALLAAIGIGTFLWSQQLKKADEQVKNKAAAGAKP